MGSRRKEAQSRSGRGQESQTTSARSRKAQTSTEREESRPRAGGTSRGSMKPGNIGSTQRGAAELPPWGGPLAMSSPFQLMRHYVQDMGRILGNWGSGLLEGTINWPAIEMVDRNGKLLIRAELPGMNKEDVKVRVVGDGLVIEGERRNEHEETGEGLHRSEWSYGHFSRHVPLPGGVDPGQLRAQMKNGVLEITMPRTQQSQPREIPIQAG